MACTTATVSIIPRTIARRPRLAVPAVTCPWSCPAPMCTPFSGTVQPPLFIQPLLFIHQTLYNDFHVDLHSTPRRDPAARARTVGPHALTAPPRPPGRPQLPGRPGRPTRPHPPERLQS